MMGCALALGFALPGAAAQNVASANEKPVVIGYEWSLHSSILNEERPISVHLPDGYKRSSSRYPVLYVLDGEQEFVPMVAVADALPWAFRGPNLIVVAIHNVHRTHDLTTPWTSSVAPGQAQWMVSKAGGADLFLAFLQKELVPEIDRRYRTTPYRVLLGHSLGGLFILHAFASSPELFRAWVALSPPAFWNGDASVTDAVQLFTKQPNLKSTLFVSRAGKEFDDTPRAYDKLDEALRLRAPASLRWQTKLIDGEDHGTSLLPAAQAGLEFVFLDWRLPSFVFDQGLDSSEQYYRGLSAEYGFDIPIPEGEISALARRAPSAQERQRVYQRYTQLYPNSIDAFAGLAESLERDGNLSGANDAYDKALSLAVEQKDPRAAELKKQQEALSNRIPAQQH